MLDGVELGARLALGSLGPGALGAVAAADRGPIGCGRGHGCVPLVRHWSLIIGRPIIVVMMAASARGAHAEDVLHATRRRPTARHRPSHGTPRTIITPPSSVA